MSNPFLKSYYPSPIPSTIPLTLNPSFIQSNYPNVEQTLYAANFYAMHQYNQQLRMNAQVQALARVQAQAMLLNQKQQIQQYQAATMAANINKIYEKKMQLTNEICKAEDNIEVLKSFPEKQNDLEGQIRGMLSYFTWRFNRANQEEITKEKQKYCYSPILMQVFDELTKKYSSVSRCREDMVRFVLRKALTFLRNNLREEHVVGARAASIAMCKKYFGARMTELLENVNIEDEKEVLAFLLPYKKGSRNRTANSRFMTEIFGSDEFRKDYVCYLEKLDEILNKDNQKKIDKFVSFLVDCVKQNNVEKIHKFKRLPWVDEWLESTKVIAKELLTLNQKDNFSEEIKSEITSSSSLKS